VDRRELIRLKKEVIENDNISYCIENGVEFIQFKNLLKYKKELTHCFSTRLGGVSSGECSSLNFGFSKNDTRENVIKNYQRISDALKIDHKNMVLSNQVHDKKIRVVDESDRGKGIIRESDIIGYDGLITNKSKVALVTFYADCVPIFFFDPIKKVIASSHSGWKGTVNEIAKETIAKMKGVYGTCVENVEVAIGPSIGYCCFEVGEEVYNEFINKLSWSEKFLRKTGYGKWHINLQEIIKETLMNLGIDEKQICISEICTKCNNDVFFSHRGDSGKTGSLIAIMQLE
jgi:polyphenol oxidase